MKFLNIPVSRLNRYQRWIAAFGCATAISSAIAQSPDYSLVIEAGPGSQEGNGISTDASGNIYITGQFQGNATIAGINYTNAGAQDFFLTSFTSAGAPRWAVGAGSSGSDYGTSARIASNGDVLVSASLSAPITLAGTEIMSPGGREAVLARFNADGHLLWATNIGGPNNDDADDLAIDLDGNILLAGRINGVVNVGSTSIGTDGRQRQFLAKFNSAGSVIWANAVTTETAAAGTGIEIDAQNNILFTGQERTNGQSFVFVAKFNPAGERLWAVKHLGNSSSVGTGIAADAIGNVYVCGTFATATFTIGSTTLDNPNSALRGFVAKYDPAGNPLWAKRIGGRAYRLAVSPNGTVYTCGFFLGTSGDVDGTPLTAVGSNDGFVTRHNADGTMAWVKHAGSATREIFRSIALDDGGNVHFTGEGSSEAFGLEPFLFLGSVVIARLETASAPAGPSVEFMLLGNALRISWPAEFEGYQLQATTDLGSAFGLPPALTPVEGETNAFTIPINGQALFLRLNKL